MNPPHRRRKRIRLDLESYAVPGTVWHVTIGTLERQPIFREQWIAQAIVESITFQCRKTSSDLLMYCVMPEHVHMVIGIADDGDLMAIIHDFKSFTTNLWRKRTGKRRLWQESFFDHGVRKSERMDDLVAYVVENPIKEGLVTNWRDYPWLGGLLIDEE
jgi:putative transposase